MSDLTILPNVRMAKTFSKADVDAVTRFAQVDYPNAFEDVSYANFHLDKVTVGRFKKHEQDRLLVGTGIETLVFNRKMPRQIGSWSTKGEELTNLLWRALAKLSPYKLIWPISAMHRDLPSHLRPKTAA